ncbi:hypothetical protein JHK85_029105 [Glycine max]|nr:hypothetical protein JHK85_029105 [Glycine max]KAG5004421.1 hypothetical protein JHK86_028560 [Glycine max]
MATVTASSYAVSGSACHSHRGASRREAKVNSLAQVSLNYDGLRSLNKLHVRTTRAAKTKTLLSAKSNKSGHDGVLGRIKCGMNMIFVGTEVAPWSKTGGLGDVLGGLPPALAGNGHRVMTVSPRYDQYKDAWDTSVTVEVKIGDRIETVRFFHCYKRGVDRVFVDHPCFLEKVWGKTRSKLYGPSAGVDYEDNQLRFSLLCQAALEAPRVLNLNSNKYFSGPYGDDVIFIANDWHTALLPCYLKSMYQTRGIYQNAKVAFCLHNIAYQGRHAFADFSLLNLPREFKGSFDFTDGHVKPVKGRKLNWMKAAILESDRVLTVSPYYAQELVSGEERGVELDNIIRSCGITGIVNGMDNREWSPKTDKFIDLHYDATTGTGKKVMEKQIEQLEEIYPDKVRGVAKFNGPLAHKIIAGADFIVIPSRFEPCGLVQLHAMPYGTVPIVSSTGGLVDTVQEGYTGFHMGAFNVECEAVDPVDVEKLATTVKRALGTYGTPAMTQMIQNCMAQDFSWKGPAKQWEKVLLSLEVAGSEPGIDGDEIAPLAKENVANP